jgi:queuine tRNA-ribosyltransferase
MYAVVHGGVDPELRKKSAEILGAQPFDGFAIGGSLGKTHQEMFTMLTDLMPHVPYERPNHLLGIGDLVSVEPVIKLGIDTMDSSHPTRCARHGLLFSTQGLVKILNSKYQSDLNPIDPSCTCYTCKRYSAAYLRHLFKAHELTAYQLASIHNLHFMVQLMQAYREKILAGDI